MSNHYICRYVAMYAAMYVWIYIVMRVWLCIVMRVWLCIVMCVRLCMVVCVWLCIVMCVGLGFRVRVTQTQTLNHMPLESTAQTPTPFVYSFLHVERLGKLVHWQKYKRNQQKSVF